MGFAVDGTGSVNSPNYSGDTASVAASLTTSQAGVIWAAITNRGFSKSSTAKSTITDNSGQGLTWVFAGGMAGAVINGYTELWYAVTSAALSAATITCTFATHTETATMIVWGEDGIGSTVLDPNGSLPIETATGTGASPETVNFSTSNGVDVGFVVVSSEAGVSSISAGWTLIATQTATLTANYNTSLQVYYQGFTSPQASLAVVVSVAAAPQTDMGIIIVAAEGVTTISTRAQFASVGM